jgi:hypothetical protein
MRFTPEGEEPFHGTVYLYRFLPLLPADLEAVEPDELLVAPDMPRQVIVFSRWLLGGEEE